MLWARTGKLSSRVSLSITAVAKVALVKKRQGLGQPVASGKPVLRGWQVLTPRGAAQTCTHTSVQETHTRPVASALVNLEDPRGQYGLMPWQLMPPGAPDLLSWRRGLGSSPSSPLSCEVSPVPPRGPLGRGHVPLSMAPAPAGP